MSEYRTTEQFHEIIESMINGNWRQAAGECVEYGFYANDLLIAADEAGWETGDEMYKDLVLLAEMAAETRLKS